MTQVYVTSYELVGEAAARAAAHFSAIRDTRKAWWDLSKEAGATGFRPGHHGWPPRALIFAGREPPKGWRYVGRPDAASVECVPHKGTTIGKLAASAMAGLPRAPDDSDLVGSFGWHEMPSDGRSLYFATATQVVHPAARYFIRLPRFDGDGWEPPEGVVAIPESELMRAIEGHNAEARRAREVEAA